MKHYHLFVDYYNVKKSFVKCFKKFRICFNFIHLHLILNIFILSRLKNASVFLNKSDVELILTDFTGIINKSSYGNVVYCDPTFATVSRENFDRYNGQIFKWDDQLGLAK